MNSSGITRYTGYITTTNYSLTHPTFAISDYCNCPVIMGSISYMCKLIYNLLETVYYALNCHTAVNYIKEKVFRSHSSASAAPSSHDDYESANNREGGRNGTSAVLNPILGGGGSRAGGYQPVKQNESPSQNAESINSTNNKNLDKTIVDV